MISITTKLHILLILTIIGVSLYMFMMYKEIKMFEKDLATVKTQIHEILHKQENVVAPSKSNSGSGDVVEDDKKDFEKFNVDQPIEITTNNVDDDVSITSNEIKDILTNIQHVDDDEDEPAQEQEEQDEQQPEEVVKKVIETSISEQVPVVTEDDADEQDVTITQAPVSIDMTNEQLQACKYEDLRSFMRRSGLPSKGSKQELIKKILELNAAAAATNSEANA